MSYLANLCILCQAAHFIPRLTCNWVKLNDREDHRGVRCKVNSKLGNLGRRQLVKMDRGLRQKAEVRNKTQGSRLQTERFCFVFHVVPAACRAKDVGQVVNLRIADELPGKFLQSQAL